MYYIFKPGNHSWLCVDQFKTYKEAEDMVKILPRPGNYTILKDTYPENEYGAPAKEYPGIIESEVDGD